MKKPACAITGGDAHGLASEPPLSTADGNRVQWQGRRPSAETSSTTGVRISAVEAIMRLNELLDVVMSSDADDWHKIVCWGSNSGPSYKDQFTFWEKRDAAENVLDVESHSEVAVFIPDISISLAFGLKRSDKFQEKWANSFADPDASSSWVDIFYNNALVFRTFYVVVDGGRAYLPVPHRTTLEVPQRYYGFIQLINAIQGVPDYERYIKQAGMKVIKEDWPKL